MIAIIDYGVGNLFSVEKAFLALGAEVCVTNDEEKIRTAEKIVLPGVGAFGDCVKNLAATGLVPAIKELAQNNRPLLGICVGLQILFDGSEESPGAEGLGIFAGTVKKIPTKKYKVPQMGWNSLTVKEPRGANDLFAALDAPYVYFVHSYHAVPNDRTIVTASTDYDGEITAAVARKNIFATQFHPEKSGDVGLKILRNFLEVT